MKGPGKVVEEIVENFLVFLWFITKGMMIFDLAAIIARNVQTTNPRLLETSKFLQKEDSSGCGFGAEDVVLPAILALEQTRDIDAGYTRKSTGNEGRKLPPVIDSNLGYARGHRFQHPPAGRAQLNHGRVRQGVHDDGPQLGGKIGKEQG